MANHDKNTNPQSDQNPSGTPPEYEQKEHGKQHVPTVDVGNPVDPADGDAEDKEQQKQSDRQD